MMRRIGTLGIAVLVPLALLVACGEKAEPEPTPTPSSLTTNECGWPDHCSPPARQMLTEIVERARVASQHQEITGQDLDIIEIEVTRCLRGDLKSTTSGTHVCKIMTPEDACSQLTKIHKKTTENELPTNPKARPGHWHTIATDLQSFPSGK